MRLGKAKKERVKGILTAAEKALQAWEVDYLRLQDGSLHVNGNLDISCKNLSEFPDLGKVIVHGNFDCHSNQLDSLRGAPQSVTGDFFCAYNLLTTLEGAPAYIGRNFYCYENQLTSLEGGPKEVGGNFSCADNQLSSLRGAPKTVWGEFYGYNNRLDSLEGSPRVFEKLVTDFGEFTSWDKVPENLHFSPETERQMERERLAQVAVAAQQMSALSRPVTSRKPASFKNARK